MTAAEYRQRYLDFRTPIGQTRVIALGAAAALDDFPNRLPGTLAKDLRDLLVEFAKALGQAVTAMSRGENPTIEIDSGALEAEYRPLGAHAIISIATYFAGKSASGLENPPKPDFRPLIHAQELVMHLAHLDGFLADSLRAMCAAMPQLLCREKKVSWEDVVKAGNYETLLRLLSEEYVYEFGWRSVRDKISYLESVHGLVFAAEESVLTTIDEAEGVRHLVIHNASRVSHEYIKRSGKVEQLGTLVSVQADLAHSLATSVEKLGSAVYAAVTAKYLVGNADRQSGG